MIGVHLLIAQANRQVPPHLSLPLFWGVFGSGLTFVAIWLWGTASTIQTRYHFFLRMTA